MQGLIESNGGQGQRTYCLHKHGKVRLRDYDFERREDDIPLVIEWCQRDGLSAKTDCAQILCTEGPVDGRSKRQSRDVAKQLCGGKN